MGDAEEVGGGMTVDGENMTKKNKKRTVHNMGVKKHVKTRGAGCIISEGGKE